MKVRVCVWLEEHLEDFDYSKLVKAFVELEIAALPPVGALFWLSKKDVDQLVKVCASVHGFEEDDVDYVRYRYTVRDIMYDGEDDSWYVGLGV